MAKIRLVVIIVAGTLVLVGLVFFIIGFLKPKVAGLYIDTNPPSTVFLDNEEVGRTPFETTKDPGEIVVKLIPESFQVPLSPYETKVNLVAGVKTVIRRDFGELEETSAGEILSFEKIGKDESALTVVSIPDSSELVIDGRDKAFTPHKTSSVLPGEHILVLNTSGYKERIVEVKTYQGYKLTAIVKLAKGQEGEEKETPSVTPSPAEKEEKREMVEILSTPTGYLRARKEPSTLGEEVGRVEPGGKYPLLEVDEKTGWFKIEFTEDSVTSDSGAKKEGWISNQYAKRLGTSSKTTPIPTKKVTPTPTPKITPKSTASPTP